MRRWLPTLWLGFVIVRYGSSAFKTLSAPFNPGLDIEWAEAWLAFLLLAIVSLVVLKPAMANRLWFGNLGAATLAVLLLSHTWLPALIGMVIISISTGLGGFVLRRLGIMPRGLIEGLVVSTPVGIGLLTLGQLVLALIGQFNSTTSWFLLFLATGPAIVGIRFLFRQRCEEGVGKHAFAVIPLAWVFFLNLLWATAPEIQFDATSVHLAVPRLYLDQGRLVDLPYFFHSYFAHLLNMFFGLCLAAGGPLVAKWIVLSLGVTTAAGVFVIGGRLFNAEAGLWAALVFYSTPLVMWLSGTTYTDLAETSFIVAAFLAFVRWFESPSNGWIAVAGWISGVAVGTKVHALTLLAVLPVAVLWFVWRRERRFGLREFTVYGVALLVVAAPWFAIVYGFTGNPVYPFMNAVFRSSQWELENTSLNAADFGIGFTAPTLLRLPFRLTWDTIRFGEALPRGGLGFSLLLAFPLALLVFRPLGLRGVLWSAVGLHFISWAASFQYGRYFVPALPLLCILGCGAFFLTQSTLRWNRILLFIGVLFQVPIASVIFWNIPERYPLEHGIGREAAENLLERGLPLYGAAKHLNAKVQPGEKVISAGGENVRFYLDAPLHTMGEAARGQELLTLSGLKPDRELAAGLIRSGFRYLLIPLAELRNPAPYHPYFQPEFLRRFGSQVYRDDTVAVVEICADDCDPVRR